MQKGRSVKIHQPHYAVSTVRLNFVLHKVLPRKQSQETIYNLQIRQYPNAVMQGHALWFFLYKLTTNVCEVLLKSSAGTTLLKTTM